MSKEKEKRERSKESKVKESTTTACTCAGARACEGDIPLPAVIDVKTLPTLELLLSFAHRRCNFFDDAFTREWFRVVQDEYCWCYPETGDPIRHWPAYFRMWRNKQKTITQESKGRKYATRGRRLTANQSCIVDYDLPV